MERRTACPDFSGDVRLEWWNYGVMDRCGKIKHLSSYIGHLIYHKKLDVRCKMFDIGLYIFSRILFEVFFDLKLLEYSHPMNYSRK